MKKIPSFVPFAAMENETALYDFFMNLIEPDLVTSNLPVLDNAYVGETTKEREDRYAQYEAAFAICDAAIQEFFDDARKFAKNLGKKMDEIAKKEDADERSEALKKITQDIQDQ